MTMKRNPERRMEPREEGPWMLGSEGWGWGAMKIDNKLSVTFCHVLFLHCVVLDGVEERVSGMGEHGKTRLASAFHLVMCFTSL